MWTTNLSTIHGHYYLKRIDEGITPVVVLSLSSSSSSSSLVMLVLYIHFIMAVV
jgi:hypothetical protein